MDFVVKMLVTAGLLSQSIESAPRLPRLSVAEKSPNEYYINNIEGDGVYSFNYDISDDRTGNTQYRSEDRYPNGTVIGAYGYIDAFGIPQRYRYVADIAGYRVYKEDRFKPFYGYQPTPPKPIDKFAVEPTESSITWTRPKRPSKNKNQVQLNKVGFEKYNSGNGRYNLIGPPSLYVQYD